jgi:hypothetical protein
MTGPSQSFFFFGDGDRGQAILARAHLMPIRRMENSKRWHLVVEDNLNSQSVNSQEISIKWKNAVYNKI